MNSERFTLLFPLWTLMGAGLALLYPPLFTWFRGDLITMGLGVIMLGMGLGTDASRFCTGWAASPSCGDWGADAVHRDAIDCGPIGLCVAPLAALGGGLDFGGLLSRVERQAMLWH
jgi:hypothetical protein